MPAASTASSRPRTASGIRRNGARARPSSTIVAAPFGLPNGPAGLPACCTRSTTIQSAAHVAAHTTASLPTLPPAACLQR